MMQREMSKEYQSDGDPVGDKVSELLPGVLMTPPDASNEVVIEENKFQCAICEKTYKTKAGLSKHLKTHGNKTEMCNECGKSFYHKYDLNNHMKNHQQTFEVTCEICGKRYKSRCAMYNHRIMKHSEETKYKCDKCAKCFVDRYHLTRHTTFMHDNYEVQTCDNCGKRVKHLTEHLQNCNNPPRKIFQCDICPKMFKRKRYLKEHIRYKHLPERYSCARCKELFAHRKTFIEHKEICTKRLTV